MAEPKPIRLASWEDAFIGLLLTWMGTKILDFLWGKVRTRVRFVGETHVGRYLFVMFGENLLFGMFGWLMGFDPKNTTESEFNDFLLRFVRLHKRYHDYIGNRPCRVCPTIAFCENAMRKHAQGSNLLPFLVRKVTLGK